jgi:hypothetical protein
VVEYDHESSTMRYVAVLAGRPHILPRVAECFVGQHLRITRLGEQWVLESSDFDLCNGPQDAFLMADTLVSRIHRILALYCHLHTPLWVQSIQGFDPEGRPSKLVVRATVQFEISLSKGIAELSDLNGDQSLGVEIFELASSDPVVMEALNLRGEKPIGWSHVYDVIEFCGGVEEAARVLALSSRKRVREIKQTANHYRHLGSPKKYFLPATPPTLYEATTFARDLLKKWISSRLTKNRESRELSSDPRTRSGDLN